MAISTSIGFEQDHVPVPLPGEDDLPCSDGEPLETEKHRRQMHVLTDSLELAWTGRDDVYVGADMFVYFSEVQTKKNDFRGPDVFVVLNTKRRVRKSWVVWHERRTPDVVIELISETTEAVDRGDKMRIYAKLLHVPNYYLFDPIDLRFDGYVLDRQTSEYIKLKPNARGDLDCPALGMSLGVRHGVVQGVEDDWLRWLDEQGNVLVTPEELAWLEAERARAAEEQARLAKEQAKLADEKARLAKEQAKLADEKARLAKEQAKLADEKARLAKEQAKLADEKAKEEARLRTDTERRLAEALAELERLKAAR